MVDATTSRYESNYIKIAMVILRISPRAVRVQFDKEFHPDCLQRTLKSKLGRLDDLKTKKRIMQNQWNLLFPRTGEPSSKDFDISLMICLLRNLMSIDIMDRLPPATDKSVGADLSRIKFYRNVIVHCYSAMVADADFESYWKDVTQAIMRLGGTSFKVECDDWYKKNLDTDQTDDGLKSIKAEEKLALLEGEISETYKKMKEVKQIQSNPVPKNIMDWQLNMDTIHTQALTMWEPHIVRDLSSEDEFWDKLAEQEIFTPIMLKDIQVILSIPEKVKKLLTELVTRGHIACEMFLYCLDNSGHQHLGKMIRETENKIRYHNETVIDERSPAHHPTNSSYHGDRYLHPSASAEPLSQHNLSNQICPSHSLPNMSSSGNMVTSPTDESASNHGNTNLSEQDNNTTDDVRMENDADESNMSSKGSAASLQDTERSTNNMSESYKMTSKPRGVVLIINNEYFSNGKHRTGAQQDGEMLTGLFTDLGFDVYMKKDQTGDAIKEELLRFSQLKTLDQVDSLVVALMSHGNDKYICGVDCKKQKIMSLVNFFNRDGCPAMKHKPKMFIVNACRGRMVDGNVSTGSTNPRHDTIHLDGGPNSSDEQPPSNSDMIIAYSTFSGYASVRDEDQGSWFIQHLFEVFRENATHEHVMDMLTEVNDRVAKMSEEGYKQTPAPITTLRSKWYLNPIQQ